jgi:nicotinamide riboside kinase
MRIAILGAESTGKSTLVHALEASLRNAGMTVRAVPEYLREWCALHQRTPRPEEQAHIAREQMQRARIPEGTTLLSDTTALMTAVYSDVLFGDASLYEQGLWDLRTYTHVLVTGLDLPWVADGLQRDGPEGQQKIHQRLQTILQEAGIPFSMVWGTGDARLGAALKIIQPSRNEDEAQASAQYERWLGQCEKCSDARCEHKLFTSLLTS